MPKSLQRVIIAAGIFLVCALAPQKVHAFACPLDSRPKLPSLVQVAGIGSIPIGLVHGWTAERGDQNEDDYNCIGWSRFLDHLLTPELERKYSFYIFFHDTKRTIGFDGSGNAGELGQAIESLHFPAETPLGFVAHSRGG